MDFIRRNDSSLALQEKIAKEKEELLENVKREVIIVVTVRRYFSRYFLGELFVEFARF